MRRLFLTTSLSAALFCAIAPAWAQDKVSVRTGMHDGYSRLVFDWGQPVSVSVSKAAPDMLDLVFPKPAAMDASGVDADAKTIRGVTKISGEGENLKVRVKIPTGSNYRQFAVGNKVILDVYGDVESRAETPPPAAPKPEKVAEEKPVEKPAPKPVEVKAPEKKAEVAAPAPKPKAEAPKVVAVKEEAKAPAKAETTPASEAYELDHVASDGPPVPAVPAAAVEGVVKDVPVMPVQTEIQPHVVTVSATTAMGLAAFTRNDYLWVVLDRSDVTVPPQLSGPQKNLFSPFEKVETQGGTAYRMRIPDGVTATGEGSGLVWKLTLSSADKAVDAVEAERRFAPGNGARGGTLFWPMQRVTRVLKMTDPDVGDKILVGTVDNAAQLTGSGRDFVDLSMLDSVVGMAVVPKADDVTMRPVGNGVEVTREGGLALTRMRDMVKKVVEQAAATEQGAASTPAMKRIFDFDRWMMGGLQSLRDNQQVLLSGMAPKDKTGRVQDLLMLAKMNMANDRGQEALGFLNFAAQEMPDIVQSPEYLALRGAANAMAGKFEMALGDLSMPSLKDYGELDYWRAYTLAGLEDWQQAKEMMPKDFAVLQSYPLRIQERLGLKLSELALRSGNTATADNLLSTLERNRAALQPWTQAGMDYLSGEKFRQSKDSKQAEALWSALSRSKDDLYRVKSSLALTLLQLEGKSITAPQAIDRLEGLRYHWRGDELEAQVNYRLGRLYIENGQYQKGFTILKDAIGMAPDTDISREIASFMAGKFKDLFLGDDLGKITPVDAATIYEDFPELTPPGDEGNRMIQRLAERLVDADLLERAGALMKNLADYRLSGEPAADVDVRLAAINLLNDNSPGALAALDKADAIYKGLPQTAELAQKLKNTQLLRARALSEADKVNDALAILNAFPPSPEVNRLRADIAWNAGLWPDAAAALQDLLTDEVIDVARPLSQKQADLILNRAVALNLSGDRVALSNMRTKYAEMMAKTPRAKMFDVVTRQRTGSLSSDRDSIAALVSEVDLFKDFLDSYKADVKPSN